MGIVTSRSPSAFVGTEILLKSAQQSCEQIVERFCFLKRKKTREQVGPARRCPTGKLVALLAAGVSRGGRPPRGRAAWPVAYPALHRRSVPGSAPAVQCYGRDGEPESDRPQAGPSDVLLCTSSKCDINTLGKA